MLTWKRCHARVAALAVGEAKMVGQHWVCSSCGTHVLAHSPTCFNCGGPRAVAPAVALLGSASRALPDRSRDPIAVFLFGSNEYRKYQAGFSGTFKAGLAGWLTVPCVAVPCFWPLVPTLVKGALWPDGEWAGVGTLLVGMGGFMIIVGPILFFGAFASGVLR